VAALAGYVAAGGMLLVGCWSGLVDERDQVPRGAYPARLRDLLGVTVAEHLPLAGPAAGADGRRGPRGRGLVRAARARPGHRGAGPVRRAATSTGAPAVTRHGSVFYASAPLPPARRPRAGRPRGRAGPGVRPVLPEAPPGLEAVRAAQPCSCSTTPTTRSEVRVGRRPVRVGPRDVR
jgi:beta-galactosidase